MSSVYLDPHNCYSAYTLDPEHGWIATHRLPLESAIRYSLEYRQRTAGALVAVVPDGSNPDPILDVVMREAPAFPMPNPIRFQDLGTDLRHTLPGYGKAR